MFGVKYTFIAYLLTKQFDVTARLNVSRPKIFVVGISCYFEREAEQGHSNSN